MSEAGRPRVAAALANWNGLEYLPRCIAALRRQALPVSEIVIVDNGSTDGSVAWLEAQPDITLIRRDENEGYCRGYNLAIAATEAPFLVVLNTDAFLDVRFIDACMMSMMSDASIGAVTGQFFEEATRQQIGGGFWLRRQMRMRPTSPGHEAARVFGVTGAAALYRREALEAVRVDDEYYDEGYVSYGEDIDLAWRLFRTGWKAMYTPDAHARHVGSGSLGGAMRFFDKPTFFQRLVLRNRYMTLIKNARGADWIDVLPLFLLSELLLWPYLLVRQPWRFPAMLTAPLGLAARVSRLRRWRREGARRMTNPEPLKPWLRGW